MFYLSLFSFNKQFYKFYKYARLFHSHEICYQQNISINLSNPAIQKYLSYLILENKAIQTKEHKSSFDIKRLKEIQPIVNVVMLKLLLRNDIEVLREMHLRANDEVARNYIKEESIANHRQIKFLDHKLATSLITPPLTDNRIVLEVSAGDGVHSSLFVEELLHLYKSYAIFKDWCIIDALYEESKRGGLDKVSLLIEGVGAYEFMNSENGKHSKISGVDGQIINCAATVKVSQQFPDIDTDCDDFSENEHLENKSASAKDTDNAIRVTGPHIVEFIQCLDKSLIENEEIGALMMKTLFLKNNNQEVSVRPTENNVRTYNYVEDTVEGESEENSRYNLTDFMQGGKLLEDFQNKVLQQQRFHWLKNDMNNFMQKYVSNKDNIYALF